jgi:glycosyltransferase involved in cell wall biosynthesis
VNCYAIDGCERRFQVHTESGLRVLLVAMNYAPERSGTAPYTTAWAEHMARSHRVAVLAGLPHYPEWQVHDGYGQWRAVSDEGGVRVVRMRHVVPGRTTPVHRLAHETSFAARVLAQRVGRPDVVLAVSPPLFGAAAAATLARRLGVPFGLVVQDLYSEGVRELGSAGDGSAGAVDRVESAVVRSADRVLTIHDRFADRLRTRLGADADRVSIVGNWAQVPTAVRPRDAQRAELGWATGSGTETVVLHAGNMGAKQGLETVVEAAREADRDDLPVRYVLLGDGNQRPALQRLAAGVRRLEFLPPADQQDYAEILNAADVLLVCEKPGVAEMSLPSKLTSYCAAGRPIVAATGAEGGTATVVTASGAGTVVAPGRPAELNRAVLDLAADPARAAALAAAGIRYAEQNQAAAVSLAGYDRWLAELVSSARSPAVSPA